MMKNNLLKLIFIISVLNCSYISNMYKNKESLIYSIINDDLDLLKNCFKSFQLEDYSDNDNMVRVKNINVEDKQELLCLAVKKNSIKCLEYLLNIGFSPRLLNKHRKLPSFYLKNDQIKAKELINNASIKEEILTAFENTDITKENNSLDLFMEIYQLIPLNLIRDDEGNNLIHLCVLKKKYDLLKYILESNNNDKFMNDKNTKGETALSIALSNIDVKKKNNLPQEMINSISFMISRGADLNGVCLNKRSCLETILKSRDIKLLNAVKSNLKDNENLKEKIDILDSFIEKFKNKLDLFNYYIDTNEYLENYYYILASLKTDNLREDIMDFILCSVSIKKDIDITFNETISLNESIFSGYKLYLENLVEYIKGLELEIELTEQFINKIKAISREAKGGNLGEVFKEKNNAIFTLDNLCKSVKLIDSVKNKEDQKNLFNHFINSLENIFNNESSLDIIEGTTSLLNYCLLNTDQITIENLLVIKISDMKEKFLKNIMENKLVPVDNYTLTFLKKDLKMLPENIKDSKFEDDKIRKLLTLGGYLTSIKIDFESKCSLDLLEDLIKEINSSKKFIDVFKNYSHIYTSQMFDNDINNLIYTPYKNENNYHLKKETLLAYLLIFKFIDIKNV